MADGESVLRLRIRVQPGARRSRIAAGADGTLRLQVQAPPVDGAANEAVVDLLAAALGLPRRAVRIAHGAGGRTKLVEIRCADPDACRARLEKLGATPPER